MKIKTLLKNPDKWTQGSFALNKHGNVVSPGSKSAYCFCLIGAASHCYRGNAYVSVIDQIEQEIGKSVSIWNDAPRRNHKQVLKLVTKLDI